MQEVRNNSSGNTNYQSVSRCFNYCEPEDLSQKNSQEIAAYKVKTDINKDPYSSFRDNNRVVCNLQLDGRLSSPASRFPIESHKNFVLGKRTLSDESNDSGGGYQGITGYNIEDAEELEMLESFAKEFKQKRIKMNFTQGDVGAAMGKLYGNDFSQTTISRFEALNLSCKNMVKLKPLLERWLVDANRAVYKAQKGEPLILSTAMPLDPTLPPMKKRKKRTSIDPKQREKLDQIFQQNPRPTSEALASIAERCQMEKEVVRVWFCNRRQKAKRLQDSSVAEEELSSPEPSYIISSSSTTNTTASIQEQRSLNTNPHLAPTNIIKSSLDPSQHSDSLETKPAPLLRHDLDSGRQLISSLRTNLSPVLSSENVTSHIDSKMYNNYRTSGPVSGSGPSVGGHFSVAPLQTRVFLPNVSNELNHSILLSQAAASVDRVPSAVSAFTAKHPFALESQLGADPSSTETSNELAVRNILLEAAQKDLFVPNSLVDKNSVSSPLLVNSSSHLSVLSKYAISAAVARNLNLLTTSQSQQDSSSMKPNIGIPTGISAPYPFILPGQRPNKL